MLGALLAAVAAVSGLALARPAVAGAEAVGDVVEMARGIDPVDVVTGPDGNLWVADLATDGISRVTPSGSITTFTDPSMDSPTSITVGADGNLWFTNHGGNRSPSAPSIGRITTDGVVSAFTDALVGSPGAITSGPDGNLWFTDGTFGGQIGRITTAGVITRLVIPSGQFPSPAPTDITSGPDGNLWFTGNNFVGRMTPSGAATLFGGPAMALPKQIVLGSDGNLWFTNSLDDTIGRITPAGVVATFSDPTITSPHGITSGPDGNLWFTNLGDDSVGRIVPSTHVVAHFVDPSISMPTSIAPGPDGNLWLTNTTGDSVGRITPLGVVSKFAGVSTPYDLVTGPDSNVWFTNPSNNVVGWVSQAGVVTSFSAPSISTPHGIAAGPDGNLWFTNFGSASIGRVTPAGVVSNFTGTGISGPEDIAAGPDGNLWFTNAGNNSIGRITPAGVVSNFTGTGISNPQGIAAGPDGNLWFTNAGNNSIGKITTAGVVSNVSSGIVGFPQAITAGPDGNLWYTGNGAIGRVTPAGSSSSFTGTGISWAVGIAAGPDGNLWYATLTNDTIGRLGTDGTGATTFTSGFVKEPRSITTGPDGSMWFTGARGIGRVRAAAPTVPGPPRNVSGAGGDTSVTVSWTAPTDPGATAVNGYVVTASPGGATCSTGGALSCPVSGLANGTSYTFTVRASNGSGQGPASAPSAPVLVGPTPAGSLYHPLAPLRVVDSRPSGPSVGGYTTPWGQQVTRDVQITGVGGASGVPADADAVVLNITAVASPTSGGYLTVWPAGQTKPVVSSLNFTPGQVVANQVTVKLGAAGRLSIDNPFGTVDVIVDVNGYYSSTGGGAGYTPLTPARLVDSRPSGPSVGGYSTPWGQQVTRDVQIGGAGGVPADAEAVVLNVTAVAPSAGGYLTVWPAGQTKPLASSLNFAAGQVVPNAVTVKLGTAGRISIDNAFGSVDVIVDVAGYFRSGTGAAFHPLDPQRIQDSRSPGSVGPYTTPWSPGLRRDVQVTGVATVPSTATAMVGNVTVVSPSAGSYLTVWPSWFGQPFTSSLNFSAGQVVPNAVTVKLGPGGKVAVVNAFGSVDVIVDLNGYYG